ncbi:M15 family metallopeptidase [Kordiimonas sp. SCSIO 12603]|uniref:M15 family metallopeptidase n=1 Tax=Kordiimonas sp. SCSIO 12603 TaxID=2829596 RepID=UPI0021066225|nr:M15 family metallopeptidase [Kordiimonas sp. SCSIO 12603]UTW57758.1 M15 family metallopeptidase [Kordiimonas sp. SCSIO 12603]
MPNGFVDISNAVPTIQVEARYAGFDNFVGQPIDGYDAHKVIVSQEVALALKAVQAELVPQGMSLKIYDGYRPQRAVDHFVRWAQDENDTLNKHKFYPAVPKSKLFELGYIAARSGHSRGGSVDVTIVQVTHDVWVDLDMGSSWDLFDPKSHPSSDEVSETARQNRQKLANLMIKYGFKPYAEEWWHFTLKAEPYPETYFNFPIK